MKIVNGFTLTLPDGCQCISFSAEDDSQYLVGTDQGLVYLCSTQYSQEVLATFRAHNSPVYTVQWNSFVPSIFIREGFFQLSSST